MDDQSDGPFSRPPEMEDLFAVCKRLNECHANYVLIGGFSVILHGFERTTKDIDLLVDSSVHNIQKVKEALSYLPDKAVLQVEDNDVDQYQVVRVADEFVIDLMAKACGVSYEEAKDSIEWMEIEGVKIPVASKELLIRTKDTVRPSDKMDVEFLKYQISLSHQKTSPQNSFFRKILARLGCCLTKHQ